MINNNKILTVSYGTFSCTLEGFDDSFGTMKAIAEYFRDLSADDRYFGAEPVQPDAQMLARIAEREIARHVEARETDGRIVLSAAQAAPAALSSQAPAPAEPERADTPQEAGAEQTQATQAAEIADETPDVKTPEVETPAADALDTDTPDTDTPEIATSDIPGPEDEAPAATAASQTYDAAKEAPQDALEDVAADMQTPLQQQPVDVPEIVPSLPDDEVEAFFSESNQTAEDDEDAPMDAAPNAPASGLNAVRGRESIAEKLKRIRAVVSRQNEADAAPDYVEDQHATPETPLAAMADDGPAPQATSTARDAAVLETEAEKNVLADTRRDVEGAFDADDLTGGKDDLAKALESDDDDINAILSRLEAESDTVAAATDAAPAAPQTTTKAPGMDSIVATPDADDLDDLGEDHLFDDQTPAEKAPAEEAATPPKTPIATVLGRVAAKPGVRSRVLKVKRTTLDAAIKSGKLEEYDAPEEAPVASVPFQAPVKTPVEGPVDGPVETRSSLSEEAEAELARELAELEADMNGAVETSDDLPATQEPAMAQEMAPQAEETAHEPEAEAELEPATDAPAATAPQSAVESDAEDDLSRLMAETATQMDEPEGATRRDAFAHLRAAVAAKKADEAVGGRKTNADGDEAYRDDLASVVRPRRTVSTAGPRSARPGDMRAAPLKLVAEQRVDTSDTPAAPVRPRRVAAMSSAPPDTAGAASFADFVNDVGAHSLPDLLEAAASYLSFVEGHAEFSRPQLMTKVRQIEQENFTREQSLRSFGRLLREGKIRKLKGGRFEASEQIGFQQDARAAG